MRPTIEVRDVAGKPILFTVIVWVETVELASRHGRVIFDREELSRWLSNPIRELTADIGGAALMPTEAGAVINIRPMFVSHGLTQNDLQVLTTCIQAA